MSIADQLTAGTPAENNEPVIKTKPFAYFAGLGLLALVWLAFGGLFTEVEALGGFFNLGYLIWAFGVLHFVAGFKIIDPDKFAGALVLGIPTIVVTGQPILAPPLVFELAIFTTSTQQMELPNEPEKIFRNEDKEKVPLGMVPPIRITFANPDPNDTTIDRTDPLQQRTTNEVTVFVRFRIEDFWSFYVRMGGKIQEDAFAEARKQLEDMSVSLLQEMLTKQTPSDAFTKLAKTNEILDNHIRAKTESWGIKLIDARIKLIGLGHDLNSAIQKIAEGKAMKQATIIVAEGDKAKFILEGEGKANAVKTEIDARTEGMKKMMTELSLDGKDILGAETARSIGQSPSDKIIIGTQGFADIVGVGNAVAAAFKGKPAETPKGDTA